MIVWVNLNKPATARIDLRGFFLILGFVFIEQVLDRFFKEIILPLFQLGGKDPDLLHQVNVQSGVINFSFAHLVSFLL